MDAIRCAASYAPRDADAAPPDRASAAREAAHAIEAIVFQRAFAPVAKALGFYGDIVLEPVVRAALRDVPR